MLNESPAVLGVDWRDPLGEIAELIIKQLQSVGITAESTVPIDADQGWFAVGAERRQIKYATNENDDFDLVIRAVNELIQADAHYRKFRSSEGSDGWSYAVLGNPVWATLDSAVPSVMRRVFAPLTRPETRWFKFW